MAMIYVTGGSKTISIGIALVPVGPKGAQGNTGSAANIESVSVTTGMAGTDASCDLSGPQTARKFEFMIPRGDKGETGSAADIESVSVTTGLASTDASCEISGPQTGRQFAFVIPRGDKGETGSAANIESVNVTTGMAGTDASCEISGPQTARKFKFVIPRGDKGETGSAANIESVSVTTGLAGTDASCEISGAQTGRKFAFVIPRGDKGDKGDKGDDSIVPGPVGPAVPITTTLGQSQDQAVSQKLLTDLVAQPFGFDDIGEQGKIAFGVSKASVLPDGFSEMEGTRIKGHENYGNYMYLDGSIMCWIAMFYYRWGHVDSPRYVTYGPNACDVLPKYTFSSPESAAAEGWSVHRAFYDDGKLKDGFFIDKFQCSNNTGIASSVKNGDPLSSSAANNPFSSLTGRPASNYAGAIDAIKTRGADFFVTTVFVQRALSLLSMAHAQAATSTGACAWYDAAGVSNFPKGNNSNSLRDVNDLDVLYTGTGYLNAGKTGSAVPFNKTTHNGQASGVADLNGNMYEICIGLTQTDGNFYVLKTSARAASLTSGYTLESDAWGMPSMSKNYESLGANFESLTGVNRTFAIGSVTEQVFSSDSSGLDWQAAGAGIPLLTSVARGSNAFGNDLFYDNRVQHMCPLVGGNWGNASSAGVWMMACYHHRSRSSYLVGCRAALYCV
jgi:hypothetical protein